MKLFWLILLCPLFSLAQTAHVNDDEVKYKGQFSTATMAADVEALSIKNLYFQNSGADGNKTSLQGKIRLTTPYQVIRQMFFDLTLKPSGEYVMEHFYLKEEFRNGKEDRVVPSKDLLKAMEEGGPTAVTVERILNETDLKIQELISKMKRKG